MTTSQLRQFQIQETPDLSTAQRALLKAQVKIFDSTDVDKYKKKAKRRMQWRVGLSMSGAGALPFLFLFLLTCLLLMDLRSMWLFNLFKTASAALTVLAGVFFAFVVTECFRSELCRWEISKLGEFEGFIPAGVVLDAMRIAEAYPQSASAPRFHVEHLFEDPLIYLTDVDGTRYCFGIWK